MIPIWGLKTAQVYSVMGRGPKSVSWNQNQGGGRAGLLHWEAPVENLFLSLPVSRHRGPLFVAVSLPSLLLWLPVPVPPPLKDPGITLGPPRYPGQVPHPKILN